MIEVAGEGVAESSARGREVVAGEGGGVSGRHDARVAGQRPAGRIGLGGEHVEANACEVPGIQVGDLGADGGIEGPSRLWRDPWPKRRHHRQ
jgi:hypothetical protein